MEKFVNEVVFRLSTKLTVENIETVKNTLYMVLKDYDLTKKTTDLAVIEDELPREAKIYLASRLIDGLSESTIKQYHKTLNKFFLIMHKPINEITTEDCRIFFYKLQESGTMHNCSLDTQRAYLKAFFSWLVDNEYLDKNPLAPIKPFKYEKKLKKELTDMEIEQLRKACDDNFERAVIEVLYSTGLRVSELVNLKLEDIDIQNGEITVKHGKGNKERVSYLSARAILAIQDYLEERTWKTKYLFENYRDPHNKLTTKTIQRHTKNLEQKTGIRLYPHKIRRTTATHLWKKGMPLEEIQILLGHENIKTTLIYTNVKRDLVKLDHKKYMS